MLKHIFQPLIPATWCWLDNRCNPTWVQLGWKAQPKAWRARFGRWSFWCEAFTFEEFRVVQPCIWCDAAISNEFVYMQSVWDHFTAHRINVWYTYTYICQKNQLNAKNHLQCHCLVHIYNLRRTAKRFQLYRLTMSHNVQFHMCSLRSPFDNLGHPRILSGSLQHECLLLRFCWLFLLFLINHWLIRDNFKQFYIVIYCILFPSRKKRQTLGDRDFSMPTLGCLPKKPVLMARIHHAWRLAHVHLVAEKGGKYDWGIPPSTFLFQWYVTHILAFSMVRYTHISL